MVNMNTVRQPPTDSSDEAKRIWEEEERAMREFLASLPPPTPIEELARIQGVRIPQRFEDLIPKWPEGEWDDDEDFDVIRKQMRVGEIEIMRRKLAERPPTGLDPDDDYETCEREQWEQEVAAWDRGHSEA